MTSKWIEEAEEKTIFSPNWGEAWTNLLPILERIDALLREAMNSTDLEHLHDRIEQETKNVK